MHSHTCPAFIARVCVINHAQRAQVLNVAAFSRVLWSVSPTLVWVLVGYATIGTWLTTSVFGRRCAPAEEMLFC